MIALSWLWATFTVFGAAAQTARNATQRELTAKLGTVGATHVRFLFGLPFAILFLTAVTFVTGAQLPVPRAEFWFLAFALTSAANVRTLGLVEVLFAQGVSTILFRQAITARETLGIVCVVLGVGLLLIAL